MQTAHTVRRTTTWRCKVRDVMHHAELQISHSTGRAKRNIATSVFPLTLLLTLCGFTGQKTNQGGLGLSGSVHEEAHPCFPNFAKHPLNALMLEAPTARWCSWFHLLLTRKNTYSSPCTPKFSKFPRIASSSPYIDIYCKKLVQLNYRQPIHYASLKPQWAPTYSSVCISRRCICMKLCTWRW